MDPKSPNQPRSGSDTASAANLAGGAAKPGGAQSATLASHTSKPMGGSQTGSGQSSQGPEHLRHQDKDAGKGLGNPGRAGPGQGASAQGASGQGGQGAGSATEMARDAVEQVQQRAGEAYDQAAEMAGDVYEQASDWARGAYDQGSRQFEQMRRSMPDVRHYGGSVQRFVNENPVLVGVVGLAAGLLLGALLPRTRQEDSTFGRWADDFRDQGMRYARDMTQRGREYVEEAFGEGDERYGSDDRDRRRNDRYGTSGRFQNH